MMKSLSHIDSEAIDRMEKTFRANFINSLPGFKSLNLVGTISREGKTNLAIFSQVFHLGANPALMGMIIRPDSVPRHTLTNILKTGQITLNHVLEQFVAQAHQTSARYDEEVSEFEATGLSPLFSDSFKAPYVAESVVRIGLTLRDTITIPINGTLLVVGEVVEVFVPVECLSVDGYVDIQHAGSLTVSGTDAYHRAEKLIRLSYAKPDIPLSEIPFL